ncbi:MAG: tRNA uridine-5-carboxymethylaminomethyl(34) synthesis GTPase MnmE [Casimicrobiaceae bacterium]
MRVATDTIAAIATPPGAGGIGVVRVAGAGVAAIVAGIVGKVLVPRRATLARFRSIDGEALDQGIAVLFPAPHSYTGDDVLELHGHGGKAVLQLVLDRCLELGARLAAPGEFTQRAFLNGKLDLAQAEAVADLIEASTATAARAATRSLSGEFSQAVHAIAEALIELRTLTEASLDFPEEDIDFVRAADAAGRIATIRADLAALLARAREGTLLREGVTVVLVGRPNVGKSSLLNRLARDDLAIVTDIPGTTRDTLRGHVEVGGIALTIVDTAGLRPTDDPIETLGIERTWAAVAQAQLVLVIVDARADAETPGDADQAILAALPPHLPRIVVHNKIDLAAYPRAPRRVPPRQDAMLQWDVWLSALTGAGVPALEDALLGALGVESSLETVFLARARHVEALRAALRHAEAADAVLATAKPALEIFAEELRRAHDDLGAIVGAFTSDDLLGSIFSRFCIGK